MVERYGYFVYYQPPFNAATMVLWLLPIVFVLAGLTLIWRKSTASLSQIDQAQWTEQQQLQLEQLINGVESAATVDSATEERQP